MFKKVLLTCSDEDLEKIKALSSVFIEDEIETTDPSDDEMSEDDDGEDVPV